MHPRHMDGESGSAATSPHDAELDSAHAATYPQSHQLPCCGPDDPAGLRMTVDRRSDAMLYTDQAFDERPRRAGGLAHGGVRGT